MIETGRCKQLFFKTERFVAQTLAVVGITLWTTAVMGQEFTEIVPAGRAAIIVDSGVIVRAELPGMKKDDVKLKLENNVLTLSGEKRDEEKRDADNFHLRETRYGKFERSFRLTDNIDRANISADYKDGVLTISLPKTKESLSKEIAINMN